MDEKRIEEINASFRKIRDLFPTVAEAEASFKDFANRNRQDTPTRLGAADILEDMAATFRERNAVYGDNYKMIGRVLEVMFPDGITLRTADEHNRFHLFLLVMVKQTRQANAGLTHVDSAHDAGVYSAMMEDLITPLCSTCSTASCGVENKGNMTSGHPCDFYKEKRT